MPEGLDLLIRAARVITGDGRETSRAIGVKSGRIAALEPVDAGLTAKRVIDFDHETVVLPGLVDSHVHVCEPGNSEWEGFSTATKAAAAGGITTLVDMPLDSVPTTVNVAALEAKREAAAGQCHIDVGFWGGVVPDNLSQLKPLHDAGVLGFKCFMVDSGTPDFAPVDRDQLETALAILRELNTPLLVHAESEQTMAGVRTPHGPDYATYLASRPRGIENLAVAQVIEAARRTGGHAHVLHLSSSDAIPMIASARREGVRLTAETCPHYLTLCAEEIENGATAAKCSPPIREAANRELLWRGLKDGTLDQVVSDHSPCTFAMKESDSGDFATAWGGITSLQLALAIVWTQARTRGVSLTQVAAWMSENPARLAGLTRKGRIAIGFDADFCVFVPDEDFVVDPGKLYHRNPLTPYNGRTLTGVVRTSLLAGEPVEMGKPRGRLLTRGAA